MPRQLGVGEKDVEAIYHYVKEEIRPYPGYETSFSLIRLNILYRIT